MLWQPQLFHWGSERVQVPIVKISVELEREGGFNVILGL